nr:response regulator transcription factor [Kibdelosporangium phytohabitans]
MFVREGLVRLLTALGHEVVGTAPQAGQVLPLVARHQPDVAVLDVKLPPTFRDEGLRLAAAIRTRHTNVAALVLSQYVEHSYATKLLDGTTAKVGYLLKQNVPNAKMLDDVLHRLTAGGTAVDPDVVAALLQRPGHEPLADLTGRERDVLALMAEGLSDQGIADRLTVAVSTVVTHTGKIFRKLGIESPASNRRVSAVLKYLAGSRP